MEDNTLVIVKEGKQQEFMEAADRITFSGKYATSADQDVIQVTAWAVFTLEKEGMPRLNSRRALICIKTSWIKWDSSRLSQET